ncbi:acyltransferase [Microbacterium soli]|uniref:Acyltransferase 3 domain-containing protein n=1 Tax=Microbacterium soli TaxID=446075 RepID=A0ABP7MNZ8_9MICO
MRRRRGTRPLSRNPRDPPDHTSIDSIEVEVPRRHSGFRAIAVGVVLLYHDGLPVITGGYVCVDVFFVISGFLLSTHLIERMEHTGRGGFADFYARRVRRILPAALTVAVFTDVDSIVCYQPLAVERVLRDGLATILYVLNVWFAIQNTDYLADDSPSPHQHYWSLGVEERFYVFWLLILFALHLLLRRRHRVDELSDRDVGRCEPHRGNRHHAE